MENVNATVICYDEVVKHKLKHNTSAFDYKRPFDEIVANKENGTYYLREFYITAHLNIKGKDGVAKELIENKGKLNCKLRLNKCETDRDLRKGLDLSTTVLDISKVMVDTFNYPFVNWIWSVGILNLELPYGVGDYVIRLLLNNPAVNDDWEVQSMWLIKVTDK